jgi:hypothetical protein
MANASKFLGNKILACMRSVLERCEQAGERIDFPGEGGERRYRAWLNSELLQGVLGWPSSRVIVGERFDILMVGEDDHAIATIETKTPYHKASKKERADFEARLAGFPTLRIAYFTNGPEWDRLDILVDAGELKVLERSRLDTRRASPELTEQFFTPLQYRAADVTPAGQAYQVNRDNPFIESTLSRLASDLGETVADLTAFYSAMFSSMRDGRGGKQAQEVAVAIYSQWCGKSLRVTPEAAATALQNLAKNRGIDAVGITRALKELGLNGPTDQQIIESVLSVPPSRRQDRSVLVECLWPAFLPSVTQLCAQTAHVIIARTLLYRVGEDEGVFARRLSGTELNEQLKGPTSTLTGRRFPATELLESIRVEMQSFLPMVYLRGEFDWWVVLPEKRALLNATEHAWLRQSDEEMERLTKLALRRLSHYQFESVDVDIWRNIYEHYLPADERQRLGGFYTPEELVNLVLDLSNFVSKREGLCQLSYIDPACGSGAFVTGALGRLIAHLELDLPCHRAITKKGEPEWKRAERKLKLIADSVHAIDLHPFASFLTTLNVLFMALPLYVAARKKDPDFTIDLHIFSADGLERPEKKTKEQMQLFTQLNSRIQLSADSYERYRGIMDEKFDLVLGNPPWGGVLKGRLAPVYDLAKKAHFAQVYPSASKGKYDVYGLFMERGIQLLKSGGNLSLLTQSTYLDKEWARDLRKLLASKMRLDFIVDLNPFGELFFHAMNSPCLTSAVKLPIDSGGTCYCLVSRQPTGEFKGLDTQKRREKVVLTVREVLDKLQKKTQAELLFASGKRVKQARLLETASDRWDLSGGPEREDFPVRWFTAAELLEMRQGVTPGGCLDLFLMDKKIAAHLKLERDLVHRAVKSKQLERWRVVWKDRILFYPYHSRKNKSEPAFTIQWDAIEDERLKKRLLELKIDDSLDFDQQIDAREIEIIREGGINQETVPRLLKHRIALGLVTYPLAAAYLVQHYGRLEGRVFKQRNIRMFNRRWYEYLWPRDAAVMLGKPRIICPTLIRTMRFVLDNTGYLSDHACLMIQPTQKTATAWGRFSGEMKEIVGEVLSKENLLQYCLAFMNSNYSQNRLVSGHRPTPKGSYAITESFMNEIPIPTPKDKKTVRAIIGLVTKLEARRSGESAKRDEEKLQADLDILVQQSLDQV